MCSYVEGGVIQVGVGGLIGGAIVGLVVSLLAGAIAFLSILLLNLLFRLLVALVLFLPLIQWILLYALWQALFVTSQFLLLIPLFGLFVVTRLLQLWRGIFYTCPSRQCAYRGLPVYICSKCGQVNEKLWPNLYGLLRHHCLKCDQQMPTLDILGRKSLERQCGNKDCRMPLLGRHAGRAPERLVAIVGGPSAGKTNYLLMAVNEIINGGNDKIQIHGEIDDKTQEIKFKHEWKQLASGLPADKTAEVVKAFLLYAKVGRSKYQLYLYDAPGEEFESVTKMTKQQYFHLLEGFILLVDPLSFESIRDKEGEKETTSLQDVVNSTLIKALSEIRGGQGRKIPMRVAVVISKADKKSVQEEIGNVKKERIPSQICRKAIVSWGGGNEIRRIEQRFESVEYFACSPLGRDVEPHIQEPFEGFGVLEPLQWVLTGNLS